MASSSGTDTETTDPAPTPERSKTGFILKVLAKCWPCQLQEAAEEAGYHGRQAGQRLKKEILANGGLEDAPRTGRPVTVYTQEKLEEAWGLLTAGDGRYYTYKTLLHETYRDGKSHDVTKFSQALREYARAKGHTIHISTETSAPLPEGEKRGRVQWCKDLLALLEREKIALNQVVFGDETNLQSPSHPKSECRSAATRCCMARCKACVLPAAYPR
jgi:hypothetical protein